MKLRHKADDAAGARKADGKGADGKKMNLDAAASTSTGEDRDNDLSAPGPDEVPDSPAQLKGKGILGAAKRTFKQFSEDNITDWAAALTYYGVLSIFPGALVLVSILGMLSDNGQQTVQETAGQIAPGVDKRRGTAVSPRLWRSRRTRPWGPRRARRS